jgi:hypothetical protein
MTGFVPSDGRSGLSGSWHCWQIRSPREFLGMSYVMAPTVPSARQRTAPRLDPGRRRRVRHRRRRYVCEMTYADEHQEHEQLHRAEHVPAAAHLWHYDVPEAERAPAFPPHGPELHRVARGVTPTRTTLEPNPHTFASRPDGRLPTRAHVHEHAACTRDRPQPHDENDHSSCITGPATKSGTETHLGIPDESDASTRSQHTSCYPAAAANFGPRHDPNHPHPQKKVRPVTGRKRSVTCGRGGRRRTHPPPMSPPTLPPVFPPTLPPISPPTCPPAGVGQGSRRAWPVSGSVRSPVSPQGAGECAGSTPGICRYGS